MATPERGKISPETKQKAVAIGLVALGAVTANVVIFGAAAFAAWNIWPRKKG
jgi:hypothetical protein